MTGRDRILGALPPDTGGTPPGAFAGVQSPQDLMEAFRLRLQELAVQVTDESGVGELLKAVCCVDASVAELLPFQPAQLTSDPWHAEVGVSRAVAGVAETGSLILANGPHDRRLGSLCPPANLIVLRACDIVGTLEEGMAKVPDGNAAIVTGPSRTADIEGVLVRGVHGPGALSVYIAPDPA